MHSDGAVDSRLEALELTTARTEQGLAETREELRGRLQKCEEEIAELMDHKEQIVKLNLPQVVVQSAARHPAMSERPSAITVC